ncbi:hypothetical protein CDG81_15195 [Actinopolyspora erythraea]|uniref:Transmembrane protein n=1 Tax=Actinopolyspora erythraea TaxID=414996 RepID=A0A099D596_9ACTN|nr:hypothetical protein CDG81_15195 [Actinopolyspora erythraea]KGI80977.1 hypothetical protein IL38_14560 [Actinopolyspora erythraea]
MKTGFVSVLRAALFLSFAVTLLVLSPMHSVGAVPQVGRVAPGEYKTEQGAPCESEKLRKRPGVAEFVRRGGRRAERSRNARAMKTRPVQERTDTREHARNIRTSGGSSTKCRSAHSQARLQVYRR